MTRHELRELVRELTGGREVTISVPAYHTVVIHVAGRVPVDDLGYLNDQVSAATDDSRPVGYLYLVTAGPLVPRSLVGWTSGFDDDLDDVPLVLLPRAILEDLAVWLDRQETVVVESVACLVIGAWQVCIADELARRAATGEPAWTWPDLRSQLDDASLDETTIKYLRAASLAEHQRTVHRYHVRDCALCLAISAMINAERAESGLKVVRHRERLCWFVYADGRRRRRVVKLPLPADWRLFDGPADVTNLRVADLTGPMPSRMRILVFEHVVILDEDGVEHDEYHQRS